MMFSKKTKSEIAAARKHNDPIKRKEMRKSHGDHPLAEKMYLKTIDFYTKRGLAFNNFDIILWKFWFYQFGTIAGYGAFFAIYLWLTSAWMHRYGEWKALYLCIMVLIWRVQILIGIERDIKKKMQDIE